MAKPKRWTSSGHVVGEAVQPPLLVEPWRALHEAGWEVQLGGADDGLVWGVARRGRDDLTTQTGQVVHARGRDVAAVEEALWVAAQAAGDD